MDRLKRVALLTRLIEKLREAGSWCGETHVQKSTLFLQDLVNVPLGFEFILYKHGPFSFDLRDELTSLRADGLTKLVPQLRYGPMIVPTERSRYIQRVCAQTVAKYDQQINFVAKELGDKDVAGLERLATAFFVTKQNEAASVEERSRHLIELKPHIPLDLARRASNEVDRMIKTGRKMQDDIRPSPRVEHGR